MTISIYNQLDEILNSQSQKKALRDKQRKDKIVENYFVETMKKILTYSLWMILLRAKL